MCDVMLTLALSGSMLASGGNDQTAKVWALAGEEDHECVATLEGHSDDVLVGVVAGPDYVAGQSTRELIVWRPA